MSFKKELFGITKNKNEVYKITLENKKGMCVEILSFGAAIRSIFVPDKYGNKTDIVLGHDDLSEYENNTYHGGTIGRYANRIKNGEFSLFGKKYTLKTNDGKNHLHGGNSGYNLKIWDIYENTNNSVTMKYFDEDMAEGYPGNVMVFVSFSLSFDNELKINYKATTDKETIINLTNHSYFNLNGESSGCATEQFVKINADFYTPIDENFIPTGELKDVSSTPFDFRKYKKISQNINDNDNDLRIAGGYDHNFSLKSLDINEIKASAYSCESGILLDVYTDMPGLQFYTANFLDGTQIGKNKKPLQFRTGYCFETQFFPDSPNKEGFPSCVIKPENEYNHTTIFKFGIK